MKPRPFGLFAVDFDRPRDTAPAPPPPPEPQEDVAAIRLAAHAEGVRAGLAQAAHGEAEAASALLRRIADELASACDTLRAEAEANAVLIAKLVMTRLHAAFPLLEPRHGPAELAELARTLLPTLTGKPRVVVHVGPQAIAGIQAAVDGLEPENSGNFELVTVVGMPPGDIRLHWKDGRCIRDAGATWRRMGEVLASQGLLDLPAAEAGPPAPPADTRTNPGDPHAR